MKKMNRQLLGVLAFLPITLFTAWGVLYSIVLRQPIRQADMYNHNEVVGLTAASFGPLFVMLTLACIATAAMMGVEILHIIRQKNLNNAQKMLWCLFLVGLGAFAVPIYWYQKMRVQRGDEKYDSHPEPNTEKGEGIIGDPSLGS